MPALVVVLVALNLFPGLLAAEQMAASLQAVEVAADVLHLEPEAMAVMAETELCG